MVEDDGQTAFNGDRNESGQEDMLAVMKAEMEKLFEQEPVALVFPAIVLEKIEVFEKIKKDGLLDSIFYNNWYFNIILFLAAEQQLPSTGFFKSLKELGMDFSQLDENGSNLLLYAVIDNNLDLVHYLLNNKVELKIDKNIFNAFDYLLINYSPESSKLFKLLLSAGFPIDKHHKQLAGELINKYPKEKLLLAIVEAS